MEHPSAPSPVAGPRYVAVAPTVRGLLLIGVALLFGWAFLEAASSILIVFVATFLTIVLDPVVTSLVRRGMPRGRASLMVVLGLVIGGIVIALALAIPILQELQDFLHELPQMVAELRGTSTFQALDQNFDLGTEFQSHADDIAKGVPDTIGALVGFGASVFTFFFIIFELVFLTLFLLAELPQLTAGIHSVLYPGTADRVHRLQGEITHTVSRYALGAIVIACIAGTTIGVTAWIVGAPFPLALGLITGLLDLIPQIGATIAGTIVTLATLTVGVVPALIVLVVVLVYQQVENYVLQPTIQGKAANISSFLVLASVFIFGAVFGVLGALVAVPVTASIQIVVRELTADRRARIAAARASAGELSAEPAG